MLVIKNVSHVVRTENLKSELKYQQLMVKTMSHEQLTPLNAILTISEVLLDQPTLPDKEDLDNNLQVIWSSGKILEFNIKSQLSQLQVQSKQLEITHEQVDRPSLIQLVRDVAAPFKIQMQEKEIKFDIKLNTSFPFSLKIEQKLFSEILFNLIQNAVKFNVKGGEIMVRILSNKAKTMLYVQIIDTGIGIDKEKQKTLFNIFGNNENAFDLNKKEKNQTSGVGIGLTNAKILCECLGGEINLVSQKNKGTKITFCIEMFGVRSHKKSSI